MKRFVKMLKDYEDFSAAKGADLQQISAAEDRLALKFSTEYRNYLEECGMASANGHEFTGILKSERLNVVNATLRARRKNPDIPPTMYVVEELQVDGLIIWQDENGTVYRAMRGERPTKISDSLADYVSI